MQKQGSIILPVFNWIYWAEIFNGDKKYVFPVLRVLSNHKRNEFSEHIKLPKCKLHCIDFSHQKMAKHDRFALIFIKLPWPKPGTTKIHSYQREEGNLALWLWLMVKPIINEPTSQPPSPLPIGPHETPEFFMKTAQAKVCKNVCTRFYINKSSADQLSGPRIRARIFLGSWKIHLGNQQHHPEWKSFQSSSSWRASLDFATSFWHKSPEPSQAWSESKFSWIPHTGTHASASITIRVCVCLVGQTQPAHGAFDVTWPTEKTLSTLHKVQYDSSFSL